MRDEIIKFSECGDTTRKELAKKALLEQACICVLTTFDCFGLSRNDSGYEVVDDVKKRRFETKQDNPMLDRFETARFMEWDYGQKYYTTEEEEVPGCSRYPKLLDYRALNSWIIENKRIVKPGLYELANSAEIAAELVAGNSAELYQPNGLLQNWSELRGTFIRMKGDIWELLTLHKLYDKFFTFEENGHIYCHAHFPIDLQLVFKLQDNQAKRQFEIEAKIPKKRVRRDEVSSNIHEYLDDCAKENSRANIDDCWRFLTSKLNPHTDGYLIWYTQRAEPKHLTKKQVSGRLAKALEDHTRK